MLKLQFHCCASYPVAHPLYHQLMNWCCVQIQPSFTLSLVCPVIQCVTALCSTQKSVVSRLIRRYLQPRSRLPWTAATRPWRHRTMTSSIWRHCLLTSSLPTSHLVVDIVLPAADAGMTSSIGDDTDMTSQLLSSHCLRRFLSLISYRSLGSGVANNFSTDNYALWHNVPSTFEVVPLSIVGCCMHCSWSFQFIYADNIYKHFVFIRRYICFSCYSIYWYSRRCEVLFKVILFFVSDKLSTF